MTRNMWLSSSLRLSMGRAGRTLPETQTIEFGALTLTGHGGHLLGYTGSGTLSITSGNGAGHWEILQNSLVPNGAGAYGTAGPTFAGPYTLVVTDGAYSSTVTVNIIAATAHIRELASVESGGRWATDGTLLRVDGTSSTRDHQWGTLIAGTFLVDKAGQVDVVCRDGTFNPAAAGYRFRPRATYGTTTQIVVRSETVDAGTDAYGMKTRQHGFKTREITLDTATSGDVYIPITFKDIWFEPNATGATKAFNYTTTAGHGVQFNNCRVNGGANATVHTCDGINLRGSQTFSATADYNTFTNLGKGITVGGVTGAARTKDARVKFNDAYALQVDFIFELINATEATVIEDNFARDWVDAFQDPAIHTDFIQHGGNTLGGNIAGPLIRRNIIVLNVGTATYGPIQGTFLADSTTTSRLTGVVIEHNILLSQSQNSVFCNRLTNPSVRFNTVLNQVTAEIDPTPIASTIIVPTGQGATDGTFSYNIANVVDVAEQTGTVVSTPNKTLANTQDVTAAVYKVALPAWAETGIYTRAQAKAVCTPADVAVGSGGAVEADRKVNGAIGLDGDWNTGAAYP